MSFPYKHVLLVGATSGIGAAMADKLVDEGVNVIAVGRRQERLDTFVDKHGPSRAASIRFDITDRAGLNDFFNEVIRRFPDIDCVFINSGIQSIARLSQPETVDMDAFRNEINTNFLGVADLTMKFLPELQKKSYPTGLIFTGTHISILPAVLMPAYSASKAALSSFVYCLRQQLRDSSTKVIEIWAPAVQTEIHDYMGKERGRAIGMPVQSFVEEAFEQFLAGAEDVIVGSVGPEEQYLSLFKSRKEQADDFANLLLSRF
nr:short-chain dehydrogenase reductase family [Colletotrichum truncatum]KAF6801886.1 short-chain dehydrogenase reductase family [Colletotrichum truncatum]